MGERRQSYGLLAGIVCCPRCRSSVSLQNELIRCDNGECPYSREGFPRVAGQPVLIDFEQSIFPRANYNGKSGSVLPRDDTGRGFAVRFRRLLTGDNPVAPAKSREMLELMTRQNPQPRLLVIGGGAIGSGAAELYAAPNVQVIGTDVYASTNTQLVADGHFLPFRDCSFDGVWIQAVLEHVLDPPAVAAEIYRVLKPGGIVYADTPFIQPVHEGAYDFTRFTLSGHRWLFRGFEEIDSGPVGGAGRALVWSIRYTFLSLGISKKVATLATLPLSWLRLVDHVANRQVMSDAACGVYFFGRRSERALSAQDMVDYYRSKRGMVPTPE